MAYDKKSPPAPVFPEHLLRPRAQTRWPRRLISTWLWRLGGVVTVLLLWQLATQLQLLGPQFGPTFSPARTSQALVELVASGALWPHLTASLRRVLVGLVLAAGAGIPIGILIGYYRRAEAASQIVFQFLRMISPLAWMPIAIIVLGVGDQPIYFLIAIAAVWPFIINTAHGISRVNRLWIKVGRNLGATEGQILRRIVLPAILPDILTGLRLAIGWAWIMLVPDEMLGVSSGLGYFILDTRDRFRYDQLMAVVIVIGVLGYGLDGLVRAVQQRCAWSVETE